MNSSEVIALVAVITSGLVGIASVTLTFWNSHQDRRHRERILELTQEEQYRSALYARRLEVHQEAFTWTQRLGVKARSSSPDGADELRNFMKKFLESWDQHVLYLDPTSIHELAKLSISWASWVEGGASGQVVAQLERAQGAIIGGIGLKHIDWRILNDAEEKVDELTAAASEVTAA